MHMVLASSTLERGYRGSSYQKSLCNTPGVKNIICTLIVIANIQIKFQKKSYEFKSISKSRVVFEF
jgi:hypothetical protein